MNEEEQKQYQATYNSFVNCLAILQMVQKYLNEKPAKDHADYCRLCDTQKCTKGRCEKVLKKILDANLSSYVIKDKEDN